MYLVTIINNNVETIINEISTKTVNRISGTIKQGINTIDSFTFTILPNNKGYNLIFPIKTKVKVLNTKTNKYEFIGRVLTPSNSMSRDGLISKTFVCESELAYLIDSTQIYGEYHNITPRDYLKLILDMHNLKVEDYKKFKLGNVTVVDNNDSLYKYLTYDTTWKNINDDLINTLGGELQIRYEGDEKYLDYLTEIGKTCTTEIRLAKNIIDINNEIDPTNYITRLYPLGAKLKTKDSEGNEVDSEERLTIASVNNGLEYIDDLKGIEEFGIIEGYETWDDVTEASNLLKKGQSFLSAQRIVISNKITALDLSLIGLDIDSFEVGNYYPLKHELLDIDYNVRIIEKSIVIESPENTSITLGDKQKDIKQYHLDVKKRYEEAKKLADEAKKKALQVENYTINEIYRVDGNINNLIINTSDKFGQVNSELNIISYIMPQPSNVEENSNILQRYLNKAKENSYKIKIKFQRGVYELYPCYIFSNTEIEMCEDTVLQYNNKKIYDPEKDALVSQTSIFYNARTFNEEDSKITKYNGNSNISITGGTIKNGCVTMVHGKNIQFNNVTFKDIDISHACQIAACKDVTFNKCKFTGHGEQAENRQYVELIQIDWMTYKGVPGWTSTSPIYDNTIEDNIVLNGCVFEGSDSIGYEKLYTAIGSHSSNGKIRNRNIIIKDCIIKDCIYAGVSARLMDSVNVTNCTFENCNCNSGAIIKVESTDNFIMTNNKAINCTANYIVDISGTSEIPSKHGLVNNNLSNNSIQEKNIDTQTATNIQL